MIKLTHDCHLHKMMKFPLVFDRKQNKHECHKQYHHSDFFIMSCFLNKFNTKTGGKGMCFVLLKQLLFTLRLKSIWIISPKAIESLLKMPFLTSSRWNQVHFSLFEKTHWEWAKSKIKPNFRIIWLINCSSSAVISDAPSNEHVRSVDVYQL